MCVMEMIGSAEMDSDVYDMMKLTEGMIKNLVNDLNFEIEGINLKKEFDYNLINDNFETTFEKIKEIISKNKKED